MTTNQSIDPFGHYRQWLFADYLNQKHPIRKPRRKTGPLQRLTDIVSTEPVAPLNEELYHLIFLSRPQPQLFTREALTELYATLGGDASPACMDFILTHFYYKLESPGLHPNLAPRYTANDMAHDYSHYVSLSLSGRLNKDLLRAGCAVIEARALPGPKAFSRRHLWAWGLGAQAVSLLYLLDRNRDNPRNRSIDSLTFGLGHLPNSSRVTLRTILQGLERDRYVTRTGRHANRSIYLLNPNSIVFSYVD